MWKFKFAFLWPRITSNSCPRDWSKTVTVPWKGWAVLQIWSNLKILSFSYIYSFLDF